MLHHELFNVTQTCKEMLADRGYTITEQEPERITSVTPSGTTVILYLVMEDKLNIDIFKKYYALIRRAKCTHAILVYDKQMTSSVKSALTNTNTVTIEMFTKAELLFNITKHVLVPKHERIDASQYDDSALSKYPKIRRGDPVCRYYGFQVGNLIRITRRDGSIYYRVVR